MRYFTRELYLEMQQALGSQHFHSKWDEACRKESIGRENARRFMSENLSYYIDLYWHDTIVDKIESYGDKVIFLIKIDAADIQLIFYGVQNFKNRTADMENWWLYDEICRLDNGNFEWNILMDRGEVSVCFQDLEVFVRRKPYIPKLMQEISFDTAFQNLMNNKERVLQMHHGDETKFQELKDILSATYDRESILKSRIISAIKEIAVFDRGKYLTETERNVCALEALVIVLNRQLHQDVVLVPEERNRLMDAYAAGTDLFSRLEVLVKEAAIPILRMFVQEIVAYRPSEGTDLSACIRQFSFLHKISIESLYSQMDAWLLRYIMAHIHELAR